MLATLTYDPVVGEGWVFEDKYDGMRCIAVKKGGKITLYSRNRIVLNPFFPELVEALRKERGDFAIDGEIVAGAGKIGSFSQLQPRMHSIAAKKRASIRYYVFDLMVDGKEDLRRRPLSERKGRLKKRLAFSSPVYFTPARKKLKMRKGFEGVIAKRYESIYVGKRSRDWLKIKSVNEQEFVIIGFTRGAGRRAGSFGALLLGYYENKELKYAGKVGTGFDETEIAMLLKKLKPLVVEKDRNVEFVKPKLVAEIQFTEWTNDGRLRHPSYLGLRMDKKASGVRRE